LAHRSLGRIEAGGQQPRPRHGLERRLLHHGVVRQARL
jgi:hypothetical protein